MKKICLLLVLGVLMLGQSFGIDFSVLTGGWNNEGRIGINLFKLINLNVGVNYSAYDYSYTYSGSSYAYSVEYAYVFYGAKVLLPLSLAKRINLYAGVDMYTYNPRVLNHGTYYDPYYDSLKIEGMRYYINCEYYPDEDKSFAFTGSYGIDIMTYNYTGSSAYGYTSTSTNKNTFAQIGFIYYL